MLVVNAGSGTIDVTAYAVERQRTDQSTEPQLRSIWQLDVTRHTDPQEVTVTGPASTVEYQVAGRSVTKALEPGLEMLWSGPAGVADGPDDVAIVGHRIVHGGNRSGPAELTADVRDDINQLATLAPLHNPPGLEAADLARELFGTARHVTVFDTSFHTTIPIEAAAFGGPVEWIKRGIRRYGFHGISHQDAAERTCTLLELATDEAELITIHLGGGCSATAVQAGRSVATTMGLTPNSGMVMATRSGDVDPGTLLHLMRTDGLDANALEDLLERRSGLMGLTDGRTGDIDIVHEMANAGDDQSRQAQDIYVHSIARNVAGLRPALHDLHAVTFTGGAVERQPWLREAIVERLAHLGLDMDPDANRSTTADFDIVDVTAKDAATRTVVAASDENRAIARSALELIA